MADDGGWRAAEEETESAEPTDHADGFETDGVAETVPRELVNGDGDGDGEGAVAGSFAPDLDVRPESPRLENVLFVALGVYIAVLSVGRMFLGESLYAPGTLAAITVAVVAGTALLYGFFARSNPDT